MRSYSVRAQPAPGPDFTTESEYNYFSLYQSSTAAELSGYFSSDIWNRVILQTCHEEAYARHAVVALGALHRALQVYHHSVERASAKLHHSFALQQYGKALKYMSQVIAREKNEARLRHTLISSLLTTCFETYIGNQDSALIQAQAGIDILMERQATQRKEEENERSYVESLSSDSSFLDFDLLSTFARLEAQILTFEDARSTQRPRRTAKEEEFPVIPSIFHSVSEARFYWDLCVRRAMLFHYSNTDPNFSSLDFGENIFRNSICCERIQKYINGYTTARKNWAKAFRPLFERSRAEINTKDYMCANILMMKALSAKFVFAPISEGGETYADAFFDDYVQIVDLATNVLEQSADEDETARRKVVFNFDVNIVVPLFIVSLRCRDCKVRREAIELLWRYPRREGFYDSLMAAKVASWFMNKEEEGMVDGYVPETARLRIVKNYFVLSEGKATIQCSKLMEGGQKRVLLPEVTLTW
jgi:hypothetical protein